MLCGATEMPYNLSLIDRHRSFGSETNPWIARQA